MYSFKRITRSSCLPNVVIISFSRCINVFDSSDDSHHLNVIQPIPTPGPFHKEKEKPTNSTLSPIGSLRLLILLLSIFLALHPRKHEPPFGVATFFH